MRPSTWLLFLALAAVVSAGCKSRDPWSGITAEQFATLNQHRMVGIAQLENGRHLEAAHRRATDGPHYSEGGP